MFRFIELTRGSYRTQETRKSPLGEGEKEHKGRGYGGRTQVA